MAGFDRVTVTGVQVEHYNHVLGSQDLTAGGDVSGEALVSQTHLLGSDDLTAAGTVPAVRVFQDHPLLTSDLINTGTITDGGVDVVHAVGAGDIRGPTTISAGSVDTENLLTAGDLSGRNDIPALTITVPYGVTAVYSQEFGNHPVFWEEPAIAIGKFGPPTTPPGRVYCGDVEAEVTQWTDNRVTFTPRRGHWPMDPATYTVQVRRVTN